MSATTALRPGGGGCDALDVLESALAVATARQMDQPWSAGP